MLVNGKSALDWACASIDTMMRKYEAPDLPPKHVFHYHQGVFLSGVSQIAALKGAAAYADYVKRWVDSLVSPYGDITSFNPGQLDDLQPGILLFSLYEQTGDKRYRRAMDTIAYYLETFPTNPDGGYWHKAWYRNQMWLDGLYMAGPFTTQYAKVFDRPQLFELALRQAQIMEEKTRDAKTGLWVHAWDYDRQQPWADPVTGRSREFWGRSIGWVPVGLLDNLDHVPEDHPAYNEFRRMVHSLLTALLPYQDAETGLWHQVIDKVGESGNWLETSCSCLFVAALLKAVRMGILPKETLPAAQKGYEGIIRRIGLDKQDVLIDNVCIGTGVGDYAHYCARPTSTNDLHGVGAFLIMCAQVAKTL